MLLAFSIVIGGSFLFIAIAMMLLLLLLDIQDSLRTYIVVLLIMMITFNIFSVLSQILPLVVIDEAIINAVLIGWELSFGWVSITYFLMLVRWTGVVNRRFLIIGLSTAIGMGLIVLLTHWTSNRGYPTSSEIQYVFSPSTLFVSIAFELALLNWLIQFHKRIDSSLLYWATSLFIIGHLLNLSYTIERVVSTSIIFISISGFLIGYSVLKREIINPWKDQRLQLNAIHRTSLAVAQQLDIDYVTQQVVNQVKSWLSCDGVMVSLLQEKKLTVVAVAGFPTEYVGYLLDIQTGIHGEVMQSLLSIKLNDVGNSIEKLPFAKDTFGALICTPLIYGNRATGTLLVVNRKHGMVFSEEQKHLLELFSAQASVSIAHSETFHHQYRLVEEIKSARTQLEAVLANTPNPVIAVNRQLQVIFSNNTSKIYFPKLVHNLIPIRNALPSYVLPSISFSIKSYHHITYECTYDKQDFVVRIAPIRPSRRIEGWVAVAVDITRLKELDRIKSEMIRMTSHDLKNPLQSAFANLDLLLDEIPSDQPILINYLNQLERELERIDRIISGILDLEKVQSDVKADHQPLVMQDVLLVSMSEIEPMASKKQIVFKIEMPSEPLTIQGSAIHLQRAFTNLLENAVKFSIAPSVIELYCYPNQQNILIEVKDYGVGIPSEDQPKVFDRFFRSASPASAHITGTGLGLSLVKTVIDRHNGQIWLESEIGKGTSFYISLPIDTKSMIKSDD